MAVTVYTSCVIESLAHKLAGCLFNDKVPVPELYRALMPEVIVTDSSSVDNWLNVKLAQKHGITAGISFLRMAKLAELVTVGQDEICDLDSGLDSGLNDPASSQDSLNIEPLKKYVFPLSKLELIPQIFEKLEDCPEEKVKNYCKDEFANNKSQVSSPLLEIFSLTPINVQKNIEPSVKSDKAQEKFSKFVNGNISTMKRWGLSGRLSQLFSNYQLYYFDKLADDKFWAREKWQKDIFEAIYKDKPSQIRSLSLEKIKRHIFFKRIFVFGCRNLQPLYVSILKELAENPKLNIDITFFAFSPLDLKDYENKTVYGLWGKEIVDTLSQVVGLAGEDNIFNLDVNKEKPNNNTKLSLLESLRCNMQRSTNDSLESDTNLDLSSKSVLSLQVSSAYSKYREVEMLYQSLLHLMQKDRNLKPHEILVTSPDIEQYRHYINAVFSSGKNKIPLNLSAKRAIQDDFSSLFFTLCNLYKTRVTAKEFYSLATHSLIQKKFALSQRDLPCCKALIFESGFFWGASFTDRYERFGAPLNQSAGTLEKAADRMLLGSMVDDDLWGSAFWPNPYESKSKDKGLFSCIPVPNMTDSRTKIAVSLIRLADCIKQTLKESMELSSEKDPKKYYQFYLGIYQRFFDEEFLIKAGSKKLLDSFSENFTGSCTLAAGNEYLKQAFKRFRREASDLFSGGVAVQSLDNSDGLPFKVTAVLGLNGGEFPQSSSLLSFDLSSGNEKSYLSLDKTLKDRSQFLRVLFSAGSNLLLSYCAHDMKTKNTYQPAAPLSELIDFVKDKVCSDFDVANHPMHPYSLAYFAKDGHKDSAVKPELFSYSEVAYRICSVLNSPKEKLESFLPLKDTFKTDHLLKKDSKGNIVVSPNDLAAALHKPADHFLKNILRAKFSDESDELPESEPFTLDVFNQYKLLGELFPKILELVKSSSGSCDYLSEIVQHVKFYLLSFAVMPESGIGQHYYNIKAYHLVNGMCELASKLSSGNNYSKKLPNVDLKLNNGVISGNIPLEINDQGNLVSWRAGEWQNSHIIKPWVYQLIFGAFTDNYKIDTNLYGIKAQSKDIDKNFNSNSKEEILNIFHCTRLALSSNKEECIEDLELLLDFYKMASSQLVDLTPRCGLEIVKQSVIGNEPYEKENAPYSSESKIGANKWQIAFSKDGNKGEYNENPNFLYNLKYESNFIDENPMPQDISAMALKYLAKIKPFL